MNAPTITGQRVEYELRTIVTDRVASEGRGYIVAYVFAIAGVEGFIEEKARIVVQCDDGRIRFLTSNRVKVLEPEMAGAR